MASTHEEQQRQPHIIANSQGNCKFAHGIFIIHYQFLITFLNASSFSLKALSFSLHSSSLADN